MSRISKTFSLLKSNNKKALIPFITAGDPSVEMTKKILHQLVESGADMIELGIPFSDPMADGPVIQRASERALANNVGIRKTFEIAKEFRSTDQDTPLILMGYANPIEAIGFDEFLRLCKEADVDGIITVDYPPEESKEYVGKLKENDIDAIFLLAPTTEKARIQQIIKQATGFLYYVSLKGVTGAQNIDIDQVKHRVAEIKSLTDLPVGVGFGVRDPETAKAVASFSDAIVIGSRIIQEIEKSNENNMLENISKIIDLVISEDKNIDVLVVDDNSPDGTSSIVSQKEVIFKNRVFLIKRLDKKGLGTAYIEGFRWALKRKYDFIVSMDADFSHNPSELTKMLKYFSNGVDVIVGSRYLNGVSVVNWPIGRIFLSYIAQI